MTPLRSSIYFQPPEKLTIFGSFLGLVKLNKYSKVYLIYGYFYFIDFSFYWYFKAKKIIQVRGLNSKDIQHITYRTLQ